MNQNRRLLTNVTNVAAILSCIALIHHSNLAAQTTNDADRLAIASSNANPPVQVFVPMTQSERWKLYVKETFAPRSFLTSAAISGIGQWEDHPKEWGEGGQAYSYRYASAFGEHIVNQAAMFGASSALHEDNRYFRCEQPGFGARVKYAVESTFLARHDDGTRHLSISRLVGLAGAAAVSRAWQPPSTRGPESAVGAFGTGAAISVGLNVAREFWPFHRN